MSTIRFDHTKRAFVSAEGRIIDELILQSVELWTERSSPTSSCPKGTLSGHISGEPADTFDQTHACVAKPMATGWVVNKPFRRIIWASKLKISGTKVWVEDPRETE